VSASEVGHPGAGPQSGLDAVESGDPRGDEVHRVPRAEEPLNALEQRRVVFVPREAASGAGRLGDPFDVLGHRDRTVEGGGGLHPGRVREEERLLFGE
jgi:hypothetical protein